VRSVVCLILLASLADAAGVPMTLISEDEAEPIRSAIVRKEAWTADALRRLRAEADRCMKEGTWTVTSERPDNPAIDPHDYYSEAPYWWPNPDNPNGPSIRKEGQANPGRFAANRTSLHQMADAVFTLGSAAFLLNDSHYARRTARIIRTWFLNPKTRMNPNLEHSQAIPGINSGQSTGVLDGRAFIRAIQGMELLSETGVWDARDQAAVRKWFEDYLRWLTRSPAGEEEKASGNEHAAWWSAQVAAVATFVQNDPETQMAFTFYRDHVFPRQVRLDSGSGREDARTRSPAYPVFNLEADTMVCRIAQMHGVNLWSLRTKNGGALSTVIDKMGPFLSDPRKGGKDLVSDVPNDSLFFLAFAGMGMNKPEYVALFRKLERPESAWLNVIDLLVARWESSGHQTRH
jgi:hypothetical protein